MTLWQRNFHKLKLWAARLVSGGGGCSRWEDTAVVPLLSTVHYGTRLVLDTAIRFAFDGPTDTEPQKKHRIRPSDEIR